MAAKSKRAGVPVRGICPAGHVTETISEPGRLTWQGTCSHDGCEQKVNARRIPKDATPPPPAADDQPAGSTRLLRVDDYDDTSAGDDPGGLIVADVDPGQPDPAAGAPAGDPPPVADPIDPDTGSRAGFAQRLRERRRAAAVRSARHGYRHPLIG